MTQFMELLDDYLDLRDDLKNEEENFNSITERASARERLTFLRNYINVWVESIDVRLENIEDEVLGNQP